MRHSVHLLALLAACDTPSEPPSAEAGEALIGEVGRVLVLDASTSSGESASWRLPDGTTREGFQVEIVFDEPGHYTVFLEVSDTEGRTAVDQVRATITHPLLAEPPRHSAALTCSTDQCFAVLPDLDRIAVVERETGMLSHLETCEHPVALTLVGTDLAVACSLDAVQIGDVRVELDWGSRPTAIVAGREHTWVALAGTGELLALTPAGDEHLRVPLEPDLRGLAWSDDTLFATRFRSPDDGGRWWAVDEATQSVTTHRLAIDPGPDSDTNARGLPSYLHTPAVRPDGLALVFPGLKANIERGFYRDGAALTPETTVRATLRHARTSGEELPVHPYDNRDLVASAAYTPLGDYVLTASRGAGHLDILDAWTMGRAGGLQNIGHGLEGVWTDAREVWVLAAHDRQLVSYAFDLGGAQLELQRIDLLGALDEPLAPEVLAGQRIFADAGDPRMSLDGYISCASCHLDGDSDGRVWDFTDRGEGLRNTSMLTTALRGPLHWTGNFDELQDFEIDIRWAQGGLGFVDADLPDSLPIGLETSGLAVELDALAAYIRFLETRIPRSPYRTADGLLDARAERGSKVFETAGCSDCHAGDELTDSELLDGEPVLHDVGTLTEASGLRLDEPLTGLDTPSLRGLHASAPYFHDGSAPTVRAVLERNVDDQHGQTSTLSSDALQDLERYLLSLE